MGIHENIITALASVAVDEQSGEAKVFVEAAPQDCQKPFVIFKRIEHADLDALSEPTGWANSVWLFQAWAKSRSESDQLISAVRAAINGSASIPIKYLVELTQDDLREFVPAVDEWCSLTKFGFWHQT